MYRTRRTLLAAVIAVVAVAMAAPAAMAQVSYRIQHGIAGKQKPALIVEAGSVIKKVEISLTRSEDGKVIKLKGKNIKPGKPKVFKIKQKMALANYHAEWKVVFANKTENSFAKTHQITNVKAIALFIEESDVDLEGRSMSFKLNNPVLRVHLDVIGKKAGEVVSSFDRDFGIHPHKGGETFTFSWDALPEGEEVKQMKLRVTDVAQFYVDYEITPFVIEIPPSEVNFDSGKWDILPAEESKLVETMKHVNVEIEKWGNLRGMQLFIGGCTDTVGDKAGNRALSRKRARAIGKWMAAHGLKIAISYRGLGEEFLAVKTADRVDEPKNRRAVYFLSVFPPALGNGISSKWTKLQ